MNYALRSSAFIESRTAAGLFVAINIPHSATNMKISFSLFLSSNAKYFTV